jgi:cytochrome P450
VRGFYSPGSTALTVCPHLATGPAWGNSGQDGVFRLQAAQPYFDAQLDGWVLSRYADVTAAFQCPDLVVVGSNNKERNPQVDEVARLRMRAETREALSPAKLRSWRKQMLQHARELVAQFGHKQPVDLIRDYAQPLCLELAVLATEPDTISAHHFTALAARISMAAAEPLDAELKSQSKAATAELRPFFSKGPEPMRESGFVALSQTLVSLLGNAWFALASYPQEWSRLHAQPVLVARGVEELQRFAGLTRLLFRRAMADINLNEISIRKGERVVLCLMAANRDPERYPDAHELSVMRTRIGHVNLGAGLHACVGAPLVRVAAIATTMALVERFSSVELMEPIDWQGGSGFISPIALPVLPNL